MSADKQRICLACGGFIGLVSVITCGIVITSYRSLQPDDQVVLKVGSGRKVINGPQFTYINPLSSKEWRKATLLDAKQFALIQNRRTATYRYEFGPKLLFLGGDDHLAKVGLKIILEKDEYVRFVNQRTGTERIERGPGGIVMSTLENSLLGIQKAELLTHDLAVVTRDLRTGLLSLVTACTHPGGAGIYVPEAYVHVVETRPRLYVLPHEAIVVRDVNGRMRVYGNGIRPSGPEEGSCDEDPVKAAMPGGGTSFFLPPYSKIVRFLWSNHSVPPAEAVPPQLSLRPGGSGGAASSLRRRRTSKNRIVLEQTFQRMPSTWLVAGDLNPLTGTWRNRGSGKVNFTKVIKSGTARVTTESGSGTSASLLAVVGSTGTVLTFGSAVPRSFTICSLTRYTGGSKKRILTGDERGTANWFHGHWKGHAGVARYGGYAVTQASRDAVKPDLEWVPMCGGNGGRKPGNVLVGDAKVGIRTGGTAPRKLEVNSGTEKSAFALAELIIWKGALSDLQMQEAMNYLKSRVADASIYIDQQESSMSEGSPKRRVSVIDLRLQQSLYKFQARTTDNVRLMVDGTIFWQIVDLSKMLPVTADPEGDVWSKARSILVGAIGNVTFDTFMNHYGDVVDEAFRRAAEDSGFFSDRGLSLNSLQLTKYEPMDNRTEAVLQRIIAETTARAIKLERQRSENEVRSEKVAMSIQLEGIRTDLIETTALNTKLKAEMAGATQGSGLANVIRGFLRGLESTVSSTADQINILKFHWLSQASQRDAHNLFNGQAKPFLVRRDQNITLKLLGERQSGSAEL